ncbi:lipoxygenase family protein [Mastigocoleus sp. MO_188.B34]|uniref:lipoxygenase family protein n=1 Tax=Mastigocoleus sp. MO_188.B34 TaxID=3036635 RepID=UPI00262B97F6|nr:lipoxygenase family protein [Mastigocoleus sp. MO_188.B34]MDJ0697923.1 lipoxygenase family protein [Mastigocoleus sp. MO_188.B34]
MKPYLPQNDPSPEKRKDWLNKNREEYQFNFNYLSPLPLLDDVPNNEAFSPKYLAERLPLTLGKLSANTLGIRLRSFWDPFDEFQDYEDFFPVLPAPELIKTYQNDEHFAEQRLSGANPMVIRSIKELPPHFAFSIQDLQAEFGTSLNLGRELSNGNLYIADYTSLSFVRGGSYLRGRKSLPAPIALFCWRNSGYCDHGELTPIAIQLVPELGTKSRILTPFDSHLNWLYAKICVQIADANHHEMSSHLCRTHLVMEPFAVVTARQLAENHPLGLLLRPHFRFMLHNNELARKNLINQGGYVDNLLAGTLRESLQIVREAYFKNAEEYWSLKEFALPKEIANRGLDDPDRLPHYPYRDDGMLLWEAIKKFVSNYLSIYYPNPGDIRDDRELQAWAAELVAPDGGRVKGVPSQFENLQQLIDVVTSIIFTCGPQHSAINYPQYEYMAFVPNMPLAAYQPVDSNPNMDQGSLMAFLPPPNQTADQLQIIYGLSAYRYDRLGYYDREFSDSRAEEVVRLFQQDLNHVERKIELRNKNRLVEYNFLKPSLVLNSISI